MASTDPNDGRPGFRLAPSWFESVKGFFGAGGTGKLVVSTTLGAPVDSKVAHLVAIAREQVGGTRDPRGQSRIDKSTQKLAMWENNFWVLVEQRLRASFHRDNFARMLLMIHTSTNMLQKIIEDLSILYEQPAKRKLIKAAATQTTGSETDEENPETEETSLEGETEQSAPEIGTGDPDVDALADDLDLTGAIEDDPEDQPFKSLMVAYDWDVLLDTVEKYCRFLPCVWVRPMVAYQSDQLGNPIPDTGRLNYIVYTPDSADIVPDPDDPTRAAAFFYWCDELNQATGKMAKVFHFWNAKEYNKFDAEWRTLKVEENKLKRLPVTVFRLGLPVRKYYLDGTGDDLYEGTIEQSVLKTIQNARARDSGFKQLAIQGSEENVPADQVMGGPAPIYLGDDGQASVLDLSPNLDEWTNLCKERELSLAVKYGISANDYKQEGAPQSGFAKKLDRDKVLKENKRSRKFFAEGEKDLYQLTAVTLEEYPIPSIGKLDPTATLQTDFGEPSFEEDPKNQSNTDALDIKMNAASIVDILRRKNPDLSDVELIKLAYRNKRINEVFMTSDQMRLLDVLANRAIVGGSIGGAGGAPGEEGEDPEPGAKPKLGKGGFPPKKPQGMVPPKKKTPPSGAEE